MPVTLEQLKAVSKALQKGWVSILRPGDLALRIPLDVYKNLSHRAKVELGFCRWRPLPKLKGATVKMREV